MATRTVAMALMPDPPMPTTWMRRPGTDRSMAGAPAATESAAGMALHQFGDGVGGIAPGQRGGRLAHLFGPARRAQDVVQLGGQPVGGQLAVRHDDGGAGPLQQAR